ncbi:MAG: MBL fold metallo-hydrolase [Candidatus Brocadiia bacterium]
MIERWDVVVIGHPSRNPYWGESRDRRVRTPVCTCTLVTGHDFRLLVDPSYSDQEQMEYALHRRSGRRPDEIDCVFVTHPHGDHVAGLECFPAATWCAAAAVADQLNAAGRFSQQVADAAEVLPDEFDLIPTPGHVAGHHSLRFDCGGRSVVVAGDATITRDFCRDGLSSFSEPTEEEKRSVQRMVDVADALVPGHDNWCLVDWT